MTPGSEIMLLCILVLNVSSSARSCGCVVDGNNSMAATGAVVCMHSSIT